MKYMNAFKLSLAFLLGMFGFASTYAENKISVEDFTIASDGTYTVSVKMVNDPDVIALGCKITLPEGMTIVQQYDEYLDEDVDFILNSSRTYDPDQLYDEQVVQRHFIEGSYKPETNSYIIGVGHDDFMPFIGNSGEEIFHFVVKAEGALADASKILFTGIHFDKKNGTELTEVEQDDFEVNVTKVAVLEPTAIITTDADADGITIRPGAENRQIITVSMNNDCEVSGLSMKIVLPEGMQFVTGVEGFMAGISLNERAKGLKPNLNRTTGVLTLSQDSKKKTILPGEGEILAFLVEANNNLLAETQIDINTIRITTMYEGEVFTIRHDDKTIDVFNPAVAEKAAEEQAAAQDLVDETNGLAVDDKYKSYPDEDVQQKVTEAEAAIEAAKTAAEELKNLVDEKVADGTVLTDAAQEAITAKKDEVNAAIDAAEAAIAAVEEAYAAAEAAAKAEVEATIAALQERIDNAIPAEVAEDPIVKNALVSANQAIEALKTALANADPVKENEEIAAKTAMAELAVTTLEENAAAAKEAYDKKQANDAAFADLTAELDALRNAINDAIETVNTEAPNVAEDFVPELEKMQETLDNIAANLQYQNLATALTDATTLEDLLKDGDVLPTQAAIDEIVENAKAAQKAAEEAAMTLANTIVDAIKEKVAEVEKTAADNDVAEEVKDELDAMEDAVDALEQFVADNEGNFLDEEVQNAFVALGTAAADAIEAAEDAINRSIFNKYKDGKLAEADAQAEEGDSEASQKIISDAKDAIEALQYDDEKDLDANKAAIDAILEQMAEDLAAQRLIDSQTVGIFSLKAAIEGNVTIYDLNGRKVQKNQLKKGMYIINGKKVMVK